MTPDLAVVIVTYNSIHVVGDLLDSLPAALGGLTCDTVVVDNSSSDGTADQVEARGDCRVVRAANTGYAAGINRGVREAAPSEAILVLNPDVRLLENSIPPLLETLGEPDVGIVAPQIRSSGGALDLSLRRNQTPLRALGLTRTRLPLFSEFLTDPADYAAVRDVDWALGAVLMMSRKCYEALDGWDESFFLYSEETDLCLRARDLGLLTRYQPRSVAVHIGGQSGRDHRTHTMKYVNRVRLYRRRHGTAASWCYYGVTLANQLARAALGRRECWTAATALLMPSRRPPQLGCGGRLMPR